MKELTRPIKILYDLYNHPSVKRSWVLFSTMIILIGDGLDA